MRKKDAFVRVLKLTYSALYLAIALVLPFLTGQIPQIGSMLCPMHIPALLCGFMCGWPWGLAVGFISPLLRSMIFGMPRALFPQMAHESFGGPVEGGTTMALLAAAMSAGAVAGGIFSGWLPRVQRQGLAVVVSIVVWGAAMAGFGLAVGHATGRPDGFLWIALVLLAVGGINAAALT